MTTTPTAPSPVLIKHTRDGRRVEVIGRTLCLDGRPEADSLVVLYEHPNRSAILRAVPDATHMAGRVPLTLAQASVAQAALRAALGPLDTSPQGLRERMRRLDWQKSLAGAPE